MTQFRPRPLAKWMTACGLSLVVATAAQAQVAASPSTAALPLAETTVKAGPLNFSPDVTLKLLEMLVKNGQLSRGQADELIADAAERGSTGGSAVAAEAREALRDEPGAIVVPYVSESVRRQIKQELKTEVLAQAKGEGWASPNAVAEWTKRITLYGDLRFRSQGDFFGRGNFNGFFNFAAINAGNGVDVNPQSPTAINPGYLNATEDRRRLRLRARLGLEAKLSDRFSVDVRVATGNDSSPISTNQTLGQTGAFSKYSIWLDRASIRYAPDDTTALRFGRFANPFSGTQLLFDEDINFDGIAVTSDTPVTDNLGMYAAAGVFPIFNTDFNFGSNSTIKSRSRDKYLAAANFGLKYDLADNIHMKLGLGYYHFVNVEGELATDLCTPAPRAGDACSTDNSRPQFQQFGNTSFLIRNNPFNPNTNEPSLQYFGLASKFHVLAVHGRVAVDLSDRFTLSAEGEFIRNLAFNRASLTRRYVDATPRGVGANGSSQQQDLIANNFGPVNADGTSTFDGGRDGFMAGIGLSTKTMQSLGDFAVSFAYRRLDTDATLDAFTDSDFHLGGTNAKGFVVAGTGALTKDVTAGVRWLSADAVRGPRYSTDTVFFDLTAGF